MSIVEHLPSLGGLALGVLHHGATAAVTGWLKERQKAGELDEIERVAIQKASYRAWWTHVVILLVLLVAMIWYHERGDALADTFEAWAGYGVAWFFGGLWSLPGKRGSK